MAFYEKKKGTIFKFDLIGVNQFDDEDANMKKIDLEVTKRMKDIIEKLKLSHEKFVDADFGPNSADDDEYGSNSLYNDVLPVPAGSKYPQPETIRWTRPLYDDQLGPLVDAATTEAAAEEEDDEDGEFGPATSSTEEGEVWCKHGRLFVDGSSSGDVIQGQLGDCWFLSALAVMGSKEELIKKCFWKLEEFKEYGFYVCRFFKECSLFFVVIDDRIPVRAKDGQVVFAGCSDPNELWVPLIEKAYAKLHGSYKALIGGYTHFGLFDLTGFAPQSITMKPGFLGYAEKFEPREIWDMLLKYKKWDCLMGCSIQPKPNEGAQAEADVGMGLFSGHAYSLLDCAEIETVSGGKQKLLKLRNPWGRGEWEGGFSDDSEERIRNDEAIKKAFKSTQVSEEATIDDKDGTFFMTFEDWFQRYTMVFAAIPLPSRWIGKRVLGEWRGDTGGNRQMGTWMNNPKIKLTWNCQATPNSEYAEVFIGLYIRDSRLTMGPKYNQDPLYATALAFDVVAEEDFAAITSLHSPAGNGLEGKVFSNAKKNIDSTTSDAVQPAYNFGSTQLRVFLKVGTTFLIVPSLYKREQRGEFFLTVYSEQDFNLEGNVKLMYEQQPMKIGGKRDPVALPTPAPTSANAVASNVAKDSGAAAGGAVVPPITPADTSKDKQAGEEKVLNQLTVSQFLDKKECLRERIVSEMKRLRLTVPSLQCIFDSEEKQRLTQTSFKKRMMDLGFSLADLPEADMVVLDLDNSGFIERDEFVAFIEDGLKFSDVSGTLEPPPPPVDDLLYKATDLEGVVTVTVSCARDLREATSWFSEGIVAPPSEPASSGAASTSATGLVPATAAASTATPAPTRAAPQQRSALKYPSDLAEAKKLHEAMRTALLNDIAQSAVNRESRSLRKLTDASGLLRDMDSKTPKKSVGTGSAFNFNDSPAYSSALGSTFRTMKIADTMLDEGRTEHSMLSKSYVEATNKAGKDAAIKLRTDPTLQRAEANRTVSLAHLKAAKAKKASLEKAARVDEESSLRKKTAMRKPFKFQNVYDDLEVKHYLHVLGEDPLLAATVPDVTVKLPLVVNAAMKSVDLAKTVHVQPGSTKSGDRRMSVQILNDLKIGERVASASSPRLRRCNSDLLEWNKVVLDDQVVVRDIWDELIDTVQDISEARATGGVSKIIQDLVFSHRTISLQQDAISELDPKRVSALPTPSPRASKALSKVTPGTPAASRVRNVPGSASVVTNQQSTKLLLSASQPQLRKVAEKQQATYEEVYRRIVAMPRYTAGEVDGDRSKVLADNASDPTRRFFLNFDVNVDGLISFKEFCDGMVNLNISVSNEDAKILFNRFETRSRDGHIDWIEFVEFFDSTRAGLKTSLPDFRPIEVVIAQIKAALCGACKIMEANNYTSLDQMLAALRVGELNTALKKPATSSNDYFLTHSSLFHQLDDEHAEDNANKLRRIGIRDLTVNEMRRVSRIFKHSTQQLFLYVMEKDIADRKCIQEMDALTAHVSIIDDVRTVYPSLERCLHQRSGIKPNEFMKSQNVYRLWSSIAPDLHSYASFNSATEYLNGILVDFLVSTPSAKEAVAEGGLQSDNASRGVTDASRGVGTDILCRILVDNMMHSLWNRGEVGNVVNMKDKATLAALVDSLSFSGFDAFVRKQAVDNIEKKLRCLFELERNAHVSYPLVFVHVFFKSSGDEIVVLVCDPLSGETWKYSRAESVGNFPLLGRATSDKKPVVADSFDHKCSVVDRYGSSKYYGAKVEDVVELYNPWQSPVEDAAISEFVGRLRLIKGDKNQQTIILAEDPKLVAQILKQFEAIPSLPYFVSVTDTTLSLDADHASAQAAGSVTRFVFDHIRKQKSLQSFLVNVISDLRVVLCCYDSGVRIVMSWKNMLAHLTNYRNPFVSVQLLPRFLEPSEYHYRVIEETSAFSGEEVEDPLAPQHGELCVDGGAHPVWNSKFSFSFKPPKLTACKILSTEIAKLKVDQVYKYLVIMIRQGKLSGNSTYFRFLTAYDSRSATEFQCGVAACSDCAKCKTPLCKYLNHPSVEEPEPSLETFLDAVSKAVDENQIILGPAITPRLLLSVYNRRGKEDELLGSAQMSISSVLSGTGVGCAEWVTLVHSVVNDKDKQQDIPVGEVQVELRFRKQCEIDNEKKSEETRVSNFKAKKQKHKHEQEQVINVMQQQAIRSKSNRIGNAVKNITKSGKRGDGDDAHDSDDSATPKAAIVVQVPKSSGKATVPAKDSMDTLELQQKVQSFEKERSSLLIQLENEKEAKRKEKESYEKQLKELQRTKAETDAMLASLRAQAELLKKDLNSKLNESVSGPGPGASAAPAARSASSEAPSVASTDAGSVAAGANSGPKSRSKSKAVVPEAALVSSPPAVLELTADCPTSDLIPRIMKILLGGSDHSQQILDALSKLLTDAASKSNGVVTNAALQDSLRKMKVPITDGQAVQVLSQVEDSSPEAILAHLKDAIDITKDCPLGELFPKLVKLLLRQAHNSKHPFEEFAKLLREVSALRTNGKITSSDLHDVLTELKISLTGPQASHILTLMEDHTPEGIATYFRDYHEKKLAARRRSRIVKLPSASSDTSGQASNATQESSVAGGKKRPESAPADRTESIEDPSPDSAMLQPRPPPAHKAAFGGTASAVNWDTAPLPLFWVRAKHHETGKIFYKNTDTKETRWNHPDDHSHTKKSRGRAARPESADAAGLSATAPVAALAEPTGKDKKNAKSAWGETAAL